jgi:hypothetical protein
LRKDGNQNGSNSIEGKEKELVDRNWELAGKVEGLYNWKDKETFDEGTQSARNGMR